MAAAAGILSDNHLLITGLWQGLTRLTDSRHQSHWLPVIRLAAQHLNPFPPSESKWWAELACHYRRWNTPDTPLPSWPGQLASPAQDIKPVNRDVEKQESRSLSHRAAVAANGQVQVWADHTWGGGYILPRLAQ